MDRALLSLSPVNIITIGLMAALFYLAAAGIAGLATKGMSQ
jgi:hypothetical protein